MEASSADSNTHALKKGSIGQSDASRSSFSLLIHDTFLIGIMAILAGCGLIYEYLLSHYAGRIMGVMEMAIYAMIGIMIVSMGLGSFAAKLFKNPFTVFTFLEATVALIGASGVLLIAWVNAFITLMPKAIADIFGLPEGIIPAGDLLLVIQKMSVFFPYVVGGILGFFIGMEIPLIARVRETIYGKHLAHNAGTIYGADYIGAGVGAAIWIFVFIALDIAEAASVTASINLVAGALFLIRYRQFINFKKTLWLLHGLVLITVVVTAQYGHDWMFRMTNVMFKDQVVYGENTRFQHITITERHLPGKEHSVINLHLNGRLQFSSRDEAVYHGMLVYPAMAAAARHDQVLIIGGGDGLALRNVLRWHPNRVDLVDIDEALVNLFSNSEQSPAPKELREQLVRLNENAFANPAVNVIYADAFNQVDKLIQDNRYYDVIIVDLPDPNHPDLNKLYSDYFYNKLSQVLAGDGVLVVQSTSPYHAKKAFISVGQTMQAAGLEHVEQYHENVPSFGEWGWTIATKTGDPVSYRLREYGQWRVSDPWVTPEMALAAFHFPANYFSGKSDIKVNQLGSNQLYLYHNKAWMRDEGLYFDGISDDISQSKTE